MLSITPHSSLGESANELVAKFGNRGYRYGFPDFYAAEFPFQPMNYDKSRIYSGVIGKRYQDSETRYHYSYDPNMYLQPSVPTYTSFGDVNEGTSRKVVIGAVLGALAILGIGFALLNHASRERDDWE